MANKYTTLVPTPSRSSINSGLSFVTNEDCFHYLGKPGRNSKIVTEDVGPFKVTGHKVAVLSLRHIFDRVKLVKPDLYKLIGTEGMYNYRAVRGSTWISNHSWGIAIDLKIGGVLPWFNEQEIPQGFIDLYPFFREYQWAWGAGYRKRTDAMHFEVSKQLLIKWQKLGLI